MEFPQISVVLPLYNAAKYIEDAIHSIINQTFTDWELIIVDDCSTDNSYEIAKKFENDKIKVLKQPENKGYPFAMNAGIAIANGKYLARMDADDVISPVKFEKQINFLKKFPDAAFVSTYRYWISPSGKSYTTDTPEIFHGKEFIVETWDNIMSGRRHFTDAASIVNMAKVKQLGGYRTYSRSGMDVDMWLRLLDISDPGITLTQPLYGRRLLPDAIIFNPQTNYKNKLPRYLAKERKTIGSDSLNNGVPVENILKKMKEEFEDDFQQTYSNQNVIKFLSSTAATCAYIGDYAGAFAFLKKSIELSGLKNFGGLVAFNFIRKYFSALRHKPVTLLNV